jgi:Flp pilus assembly protein TadG
MGIKSLKNIFRANRLNIDESGSAISEFVLVAIPLFLPAMLFFNSMHSTATEEINVSHIARQAVRAFATAPDLYTGHSRVKFLLDKFNQLEVSGVNSLTNSTFNSSINSSSKKYGFTYNIKCGAENCLEPGSLVELQLFREVVSDAQLSESKNRKATAIAKTYVDKWRETEDT